MIDVKRLKDVKDINELDTEDIIKSFAKVLTVIKVTVGNWRRKFATIEKWSAAKLTLDDCLKKRITIRESDYKNKSGSLYVVSSTKVEVHTDIWSYVARNSYIISQKIDRSQQYFCHYQVVKQMAGKVSISTDDYF